MNIFCRFSRKIFLQEFPTRFSCKNFPQDFPARIYRKIFRQEFPAFLGPLEALKLYNNISIFLYISIYFYILRIGFRNEYFLQNFPQDFPARISHEIFLQDFPTRISRKIFPQEFPTRFFRNILPSWILISWLPITLFQMLNFHQSLLC